MSKKMKYSSTIPDETSQFIVTFLIIHYLFSEKYRRLPHIILQTYFLSKKLIIYVSAVYNSGTCAEMH